MKRHNIRQLLTNPELYQEMMVQEIIATQAREGINVPHEEALTIFYWVTEAQKWPVSSLLNRRRTIIQKKRSLSQVCGKPTIRLEHRSAFAELRKNPSGEILS